MSASPHKAEAGPVLQSGAYALVRDETGRLLIVAHGNGRFYLPGGRLEPGEEAAAGLAREIEEECGWTARIGRRLHACAQPIMGGRVLLDTLYLEAALVGRSGAAGEHLMLWLAPDEAAARLHREGDRAAVRLAWENASSH